MNWSRNGARLYGSRSESLISRYGVQSSDYTLMVAGIDSEETKVKRSLKEAAKRNDKGACVSLAKE
jgi:hypothetical protein